VSERREVVIGTSVLGRPIEAVQFTAPAYAKPRPPALLFAAMHGDEPVSQLMLERLADELIERPPGRETWIVPCLNPDGIMAGTRNNANDVVYSEDKSFKVSNRLTPDILSGGEFIYELLS
jgi:predicted deacylase